MDSSPRSLIASEVHRKRLYNITEEMAITLVRTSGSPVVTEGKDFSTCLMDDIHGQVGFSGYISFHISTSFLGVEAVLEHYDRDELHPGDAFLCNDPHTSGAIHQGDIGIVMPYFHDQDLVGWGYVNEHVLDIGGSGVSGFAPDATDCYAEGPRFPAVRIMTRGQFEPEWERFIRTNVRIPVPVMNDIRSMIAANNVGQSRLSEVIDRYGLDTHRDHVAESKRASERALRQRIENTPDGVYQSTDWIEFDGRGRSELHEVTCELRVKGNEISFQFRGDPQTQASINGTRPVVLGQTMSTLLCQYLPDVPVNAGIWEPLDFDLGPEGTIVNAVPPAPVTQGHAACGMKINKLVSDIISQAVSQSNDETVRKRVAGQPNSASTVITASGVDNRSGDPFVMFPVSLAVGVGGGAQSVCDGLDAYGSHPTLGLGMPDVEVEESTTPGLILWRRVRPNSGGPGRYRGGLGMTSAIALLHADEINGTAFLENTEVPPRGAGGGFPGSTCEWHLLRGTNVLEMLETGTMPTSTNLEGTIREMASKTGQVSMQQGDVMVVRNGGGGGLGDPLARPPDSVARDVVDGYVTREHARDVYGVVLNDTGSVDAEATQRRRRSIRAERIDGEPETPDVPTEDVVAPVRRRQDHWSCVVCGERLAPLEKTWREVLEPREHPIEVMNGDWGMFVRPREVDPQLLLRFYFCPGCGTSLSVEVELASSGNDR